MSLLHPLLHLFGMYTGNVVTVRIDNTEVYWIAFQCKTCGDISGLCKPLGRSYEEQMNYERQKEKDEKE